MSRFFSSKIAIRSLAVASVGISAYAVTRQITSTRSGEPQRIFGGFNPTKLQVKSSEVINHNTKKICFEFPDPNAVSGLTLTSAILVLSWPKGSWKPVIRPYTPISDLNKPGHVDFLIKKYPNGKQSSHIHSLQPGDCLYFLAPLKGYSWTANKFPHVTLIAGGAGITPIYQLAKGILDNPEDNTSITMILGVNGDQDVLLKQEFDHWRKQFPERFQAVYTASKPIEGSELRKGYVNAELLKEVVKMKDNDMIFVCGPPAMEKTLCGEKSLKGVLEELGYRKDQVHRF